MPHNSLESVTLTLPEYWAPALINNDFSGLSKDEVAQIKNFLEEEDLPYPVGCSDEAYFSWSNDSGNKLGGNVLEYHFLIHSK